MTSQQAVPMGTGAGMSPRFAFDARRWTRYEVIAAGLSVVLLFFLPRPWYDLRLATNCNPLRGTCRYQNWGSTAGTDAHGFLWLAVLPFLMILAILILRAGFGRVSFLIWPTDRQLLAGAACTNLIIVLAAFLMKSGHLSAQNPRQLDSLPVPSLSITWESAAYIALAIAGAAAAAAVLNLASTHHHA